MRKLLTVLFVTALFATTAFAGQLLPSGSQYPITLSGTVVSGGMSYPATYSDTTGNGLIDTIVITYPSPIEPSTLRWSNETNRYEDAYNYLDVQEITHLPFGLTSWSGTNGAGQPAGGLF